MQTKDKLILLQLILLAMVVLFFALTFDWRGLISALLGGSAWVIPSLCFTHILFKTKKNHNPQSTLNILLLGESIKLLLSAGLIILILLTVTIKTWGFLSGYIAVIVASFLLPFVYQSKKHE